MPPRKKSFCAFYQSDQVQASQTLASLELAACVQEPSYQKSTRKWASLARNQVVHISGVMVVFFIKGHSYQHSGWPVQDIQDKGLSPLIQKCRYLKSITSRVQHINLVGGIQGSMCLPGKRNPSAPPTSPTSSRRARLQLVQSQLLGLRISPTTNSQKLAQIGAYQIGRAYLSYGIPRGSSDFSACHVGPRV